jgi:hypothetical protein
VAKPDGLLLLRFDQTIVRVVVSNRWKPPMRFGVIVAFAAFALAGCNANQEVSPSSRTVPGVVAGPDFPGYNAYDPTKYAQTSGFYAGGSGGR